MKWVKERDELIAQTMAFVQSVTGRKPQASPDPVSVSPVLVNVAAAAEGPFAQPDASPVATAVPTENLLAAKPIETSVQASDQPPLPAPSDIRREIQSRVAAFQAHQHRFLRERDAYCNAVLTKTRLAIEKGPEAPTS